MRRLLVWSLVLGLLLAPVLPAAAQTLPPQFGIVAHGVVAYSTASIAMANTANEVTLFQYSIPTGWLNASSSATVNSSAPLHVMLNGSITTNGTPPVLNLGVNLGGSTSTLTLWNGQTPTTNYTNAPFQIDCWINPISTSSTSGVGGVTHMMMCRSRWATTTITPQIASASEAVQNALVLGTTPLNSASGTQINILGRWGTGANNSNAINIYGGVVLIGN